MYDFLLISCELINGHLGLYRSPERHYPLVTYFFIVVDMPRNRQRTTAKAAWTEEDLRSAKTAIEGGMSKRKAAKQYNIPFTTLRDRLKNENMSNPSLGRKPVFTQQQETEIAEQVKLLGSLYYGLDVVNLRKLVYKYAELNNIKNNFDRSSKTAGLDWVHAFMRRNPSVSIRKAEATSLNRISAFNKVEITYFYDKLEDVMEKHKFIPNNIYNADETGITTVTDPGKVLAEKGQKRVGFVTSGERGSNITIMCAMSAAGNFIPPMFIFARQRMTPLLEKDGPASALYTNSKNGWINEDLFVTWLKHFAAFSKPTQESPVLLILDNHSSHISLQAYNFCKENYITMLSIPPHSSHRTQPLDVSFYGPLKAAYRHECNRHMKTHLMSRITPYDVAGLFNKAYVQVANISKAESGFRATGIYPLNPNVFTEQDFLAASLMAQESEQTTENLDPNVQNLEDPQPDGIAIISKHTSPLPCSSNKDQRSESVLAVASNHQELIDEQRTPVSFDAIATTPTIEPSSKPRQRKRKQHAAILTSTPMKIILEEKQQKKIAKLNKTGKGDKSKPKKVVKEKKNKHIKQKSYKRKILQESSSESEDEEHLCDDDSDDGMNVDDENHNKCIICEEFGKNNEMWYRCTFCGLWAHAICSGWDSPDGYICDLCLRK